MIEPPREPLRRSRLFRIILRLSPQMDISTTPAGEIAATPSDELHTLVYALRWRWKLILAGPLLALAAVALAQKTLPANYRSQVELRIYDPERHDADLLGRSADSGRDFDSVAINTEIEVLQSEELLQRVAKQLELDRYPEFQASRGRLRAIVDWLARWQPAWAASLWDSLLRQLGLQFPEPAEDRSADAAEEAAARIEDAATLLRNRIRVDRVPFSYILSVTASAKSPKLAQRLAATIVDNYAADQVDSRRRALRERAEWLSGQLKELKSRVVDTETTIEKLKAQLGLSDAGKGSATEQQIVALNAQLMLARAEVDDKRARLEQARRLSSSNGAIEDIPEAMRSPVLNQLRLQQSLLIRRQAQLRSQLGERHAEVLALATQLAAVNKAIGDEAAHILNDLKNSYDIAVRRQESLDASLQELKAAQGNAGNYAQLQQLQRIALADGKLYESYLSQYNEIAARESLELRGPRLINPATLPTAPSFPKSVYAAAAVMGLIGAALLAILLEYSRARVSTGAMAEQRFGYPVVGAVPLLPRRRHRHRDPSRSLVQTIASAPLSPFSEAVRTIRIGMRLPDVRPGPVVVLVTSSLPGEGKSALATLLAASSAEAGQRTVLVDCDLRSRAISTRLGTRHPGLTDILTDACEPAAATLRHPAASCDLIPAGSPTRSPADLLASGRMAGLIAGLRRRYDYVVLDAPPLLSVVDALALATIADKILVTIDGNRTRSDSIAEAFRLLRPENHRIAGMVFNKVAPKQLQRFRYAGYPYRGADAAAWE
jgi:capsular exopolysaccharide synthesis family protein